jgi:hypothetical protein
MDRPHQGLFHNYFEGLVYRSLLAKTPSSLKQITLQYLDNQVDRDRLCMSYLNRLGVGHTDLRSSRQRLESVMDEWSHSDLCNFIIRERLHLVPMYLQQVPFRKNNVFTRVPNTRILSNVFKHNVNSGPIYISNVRRELLKDTTKLHMDSFALPTNPLFINFNTPKPQQHQKQPFVNEFKDELYKLPERTRSLEPTQNQDEPSSDTESSSDGSLCNIDEKYDEKQFTRSNDEPYKFTRSNDPPPIIRSNADEKQGVCSVVESQTSVSSNGDVRHPNSSSSEVLIQYDSDPDSVEKWTIPSDFSIQEPTTQHPSSQVDIQNTTPDPQSCQIM